MAIRHDQTDQFNSDLKSCKVGEIESGAPKIDICVCTNDPLGDCAYSGQWFNDWVIGADPDNILDDFRSQLRSKWPDIDWCIQSPTINKFVKFAKGSNGKTKGALCMTLVPKYWVIQNGGSDPNDPNPPLATCVVTSGCRQEHRTVKLGMHTLAGKPAPCFESAYYANPASPAPTPGTGEGDEKVDPDNLPNSVDPDYPEITWNSKVKTYQICTQVFWPDDSAYETPTNEPDICGMVGCVNEDAGDPFPAAKVQRWIMECPTAEPGDRATIGGQEGTWYDVCFIYRDAGTDQFGVPMHFLGPNQAFTSGPSGQFAMGAANPKSNWFNDVPHRLCEGMRNPYCNQQYQFQSGCNGAGGPLITAKWSRTTEDGGDNWTAWAATYCDENGDPVMDPNFVDCTTGSPIPPPSA